MVYEPLYHAREIATIKRILNCVLVVLAKRDQQDLAIYFSTVFNKTIIPLTLMIIGYLFKVPINPKLLFCLNKYMYNSEQNGAKIFDLGQNRNFL